ITADLERRGYTESDKSPDVLVEYGTAVKEARDPTDETDKYLWGTSDLRGWGPGRHAATPVGCAGGAGALGRGGLPRKQVLWRGHATAKSSVDPAVSVKRLDQAADAILDQFPQRVLAVR